MRRVLAVAVVAAAAIAFAVLGTGAGDEPAGNTYRVELDNAFGLTVGADVKITGVRAGKIKKLALDRTDMRALVTIELTETGFDDLRTDVRCETRPQSLIGEYFVDCRPGTAAERLRPGATIPVEQTETTVPLDLVTDIMRRPYRERFTILLSELGAGLAARGDDLDQTIRRAVPALRQVDRLLATLREQRTTIRDLYRDADAVLAKVAPERDEVARFVEEARDTAAAAAPEADGIRDQWRTLPTFLGELTPTLERLEATADEQIPALRDLRTAAPLLEGLFTTLGPYAEAAQPAVRTLADAARSGRDAIAKAAAPVAELRKGTDDLPEAAKNLAITLEHLDDPRNAVEKDARAGRGKDGGHTGLESLLRYFFAQSQAINLFDAGSHILKVSLFADLPCANYADAAAVKSGRAPERCRAWLGPNQPGITSPDPTKTGAARATTRRATADRGDERERDEDERRSERPTPTTPAAPAPQTGPTPTTPAAPPAPGTPKVPSIEKLVDDLVGALPQTPTIPQPAPEERPAGEGLLDFLLGG